MDKQANNPQESKLSFSVEIITIDDKKIGLIPAEVSSRFSSRAVVCAEICFEGRSFVQALEPDGNGSHYINFSHLDSGTNVQTGQIVDIELTVSDNWPEPEVAEDVLSALESEPDATEIWQTTTALARHDWMRWINSTKNSATREKRISAAMDKMNKGEKRPCCFNRNMCCDPPVADFLKRHIGVSTYSSKK